MVMYNEITSFLLFNIFTSYLSLLFNRCLCETFSVPELNQMKNLVKKSLDCPNFNYSIIRIDYYHRAFVDRPFFDINLCFTCSF